jgi:purine-nucleoside phosphorylase
VTGPVATDTSFEAAQEAVDSIRAHSPIAPRVAVILGSGLGAVADALQDRALISYAAIPHMPRSTVDGHAGQLALGTLAGVPVAAMLGRFHLYEGYAPSQVVFPLRVLHLLGAQTVVVTAATGGLDPAYAPGDLMLLRDHIGFPILAGANPLCGPNDERLGPRFPAMTDGYDPSLRALAHEAAAARGITLHEGVYAMVSGPSFETPAELRLLRALGADAVGMSTVPEVIAARHMGMRVLGACCVTNAALRDSDSGIPPSHVDVLAVAAEAGVRLAAILEGVLAKL